LYENLFLQMLTLKLNIFLRKSLSISFGKIPLREKQRGLKNKGTQRALFL
jgi:hypothetical protein